MIDLPAPDPGIEIVVATRGISKGLAQTDGPQLVVRPELVFGPVHVGGYGKNVTSPTSDGEVGAVLGLRTAFAGFDLAASATYKRAVAPVGPVDRNAIELAGSASRRIGPVTARATVTWSPDDLGSTGRSLFVEGGVSVILARSMTAGIGFGLREREGGPDYSAFNVGLTHTLARGISADVRWYDTDRSALSDAFEGRLVAALRARF
jgi:hypothetical protein